MNRKLRAARRLGRRHGRAGTTPYGDPRLASYLVAGNMYKDYTAYVYWDAGSGLLMDALGETSETTEANWPDRLKLVSAYCDAYDRHRDPETGERLWLLLRAAGHVIGFLCNLAQRTLPREERRS